MAWTDLTARVHLMTAHVGQYPSEAPRIVERSRESLSLPQILHQPGELAQWEKREAKVEPKIDRALNVLTRVG